MCAPTREDGAPLRDWGPLVEAIRALLAGRPDVALDPAAGKEMRDLSEKFIEKTLADLEAKGLPGREVYAKMKAMSAEYSK